MFICVIILLLCLVIALRIDYVNKWGPFYKKRESEDETGLRIDWKKTEIGWLYLVFYSNPYVSIGGYNCYLWSTYGFVKYKKKYHKKRFGYWMDWYDGPFYYYSLGFIVFHWCSRPDLVDKK